MHRFVTLLNARRLLRDVEHEEQRIGLTSFLTQSNQSWHGVKLGQPDWGDNSLSVALNAQLRQEGLSFHIILNAYWQPLKFELPPSEAGPWHRWIDTGLDSPDDIVPWEQAPLLESNAYRALDRSVVMLYAKGNV